MKIAIISPGSFSVPPVIGSSVEHDIHMVAEQLGKEHEVTVYAKKCLEYRRSTRDGNIYYKRFNFQGYEGYLTKVIGHLMTALPDIIIVENRPAYLLRVKEQFGRIPIVLNMHSTVFSSPPHISVKDMKRVAERADALITNSKYLRDYYIRHYPAFKGKAQAIHLGIETSPFERANHKEEKIKKLRTKYNITDENQTILFVGRLLEEKGIHLILDVLPQLVKEYPKLKLIVAGSPRYGKNIVTPYVKRLREQTAKLRQHIIFTKFVPPHKIPYVYQLADIVVVPSLWQEPFGRVNLEAMASTKAVVASNRGGIPELIKHEENGLIISIDNYKKDLFDSISKLLCSRELREEYGKRGMELVKEYSWTKTADEYLHIFRDLTRDKKN